MRLSHPDYEHLSAVLRELYGHTDLARFPEAILSALAQLIPSDLSSYNEIDPAQGRFLCLTYPDCPELQPLIPALADCFDEHPIVAHYQRVAEFKPWRVSDFLSLRQFRETGPHAECYGKLRLNYQLSGILSELRQPEVGLALNRESRDFTERDRQILEYLWPHIAQVYKNAKAFSAVRQQTDQLTHALSAVHHGLVLLAADGRVVWATPLARQWFADYFAAALGEGHRLPEKAWRWVQTQRVNFTRGSAIGAPVMPLVMTRPGRQLTVRVAEDGNGQMRMLLKEDRASSPARLQSLGLTLREAEVLHWVAEGKSNPEIAIILGMTRRTVEKHLEHVFAKLGVENRTAALLTILERLDSATQ